MATDVAREQAPDVALPDQTGETRKLSELWHDQPLALFFLRHLGCPLCREMLIQIREQHAKIVAAGGQAAAVLMAEPAQAAEFAKAFALPFPLLCDRDQAAYRAYHVPRGSAWQVLGPQMWAAGLRALLRGGIGVPRGDVYQLSSTFVIDRDGHIQRTFVPAHSGDHPDWTRVLAALREAAGSTRGDLETDPAGTE